jgi:murein hydrolase activator
MNGFFSMRIQRSSLALIGLLAAAAASASIAQAAAPEGQAQTTPTTVAVANPTNNLPRNGDLQGALALAALDRKIADLDSEEALSKKELSEIGNRIGQARAKVHARGRAFYKLTRAGSLPLGGGFGSFVSHAMRVERARRMLGADLENERKVRQHGAGLASALERVARERVQLASQRSAMDSARLAVEDESRRQQAFDRAFADSNGGSEFVAIYGGAGAGDSNTGGGFAAARGRLLFPIAGRAEARIAQHEGTAGPGAEIRTAAGTQVRAVYSGRVAFADRYGPYGRLVILDHGDHYYTVSANLAAILVKVGDDVPAGERIGTVGDEGHGAMLYFEVRHRTETIHPGAWLGLQQ